MDLESLKERLSFLFNKNFSERDELGASVSIWIQGEEAISFSKGYCDKERSKKWDDSTLVPVWSATKGLAAACVLKVLESHNVNRRFLLFGLNLVNQGKQKLLLSNYFHIEPLFLLLMSRYLFLITIR